MHKDPIKIALADLRHSTSGRHIVSVPIGIGYIAAYTLLLFAPRTIEVQLYTDPDELIRDAELWRPDILGLSHYCWNAELSHLMAILAKKKNQTLLCVGGGPEFPTENEERRKYLMERCGFDMYVYDDCNGETAFANIVKAFCENEQDMVKHKSNPIPGVAFLDKKTTNLIVGERSAYIKNRDVIPSPYLNGLLDKWLTDEYEPAIETRRGCPYKCAYCHTGNNINKLSAFSVQRIKDEITYIARIMSPLKNDRLIFCDTNFGMDERDMEIADHLAFVMEQYEWPNSLKVSTGKDHKGHVLKVTKRLRNIMRLSLSRQSLNPITLKTIKRKNFPMDQYLDIVQELKQLGQKPLVCELIVPLPEDTLESFFEGQKMLIEAGINSGAIYTAMMLKGTLLASAEFRKKYQMKTKYRILPKQFGEYDGKKCFEIEEVCIENSTISFDDYRNIRAFSLITEIFCTEQFDIIHRHLKELKLSFFDFLYKIWEITKLDKGPLSTIYQGFIKEISDELYDSKNGIYIHFSKPDNYNKLLSGELGDNLLRKYSTKAYFVEWSNLIDFVYNILISFINKNVPVNIFKSLNAAKHWVSVVRNLNNIFDDDSMLNNNEYTLSLSFDVLAWYTVPENEIPLIAYNKPVTYRIKSDTQRVSQILQQTKSLYGKDKEFQLGIMLSKNWKIRDLWRVSTSVYS